MVGLADGTNDETPRLRPDMASFRLLVLAFLRDYIGRYQLSPSQGEIVNALDCSRTRVRNALRSLAKDQLIILGKGQRSISLPSMRDEAIRQLRAEGWVVDEDLRFAGPNSPLPAEPELTYPEIGPPLSQDGDTHDTSRHDPDRKGTGGGARRAAGDH